MNHPFVSTPNKPEICIFCDKAHTVEPECETCSNRGKLQKYKGMMMCKECLVKEQTLDAEHQSAEKQEQRVRESRERERIAQMTNISQPILSLAGVVDRARQIDQTLQVNSDIYNAQTTDDQTVKAAIFADDTIPADQKLYKYSQFLDERHTHFQNLIFGINKQLAEYQTRQRVLQQDYNAVANKLREEERAKISLNSPNYQPTKVKTTKVNSGAGSLGSQKQKFNKAELIATAAKLQEDGYPAEWSTLQTIATRRNMTIAQAAVEFKKQFDAVAK